MNYDNEQLGVNNPSHPANSIEVFDEIELTEGQLIIQDLTEEIRLLRKEHEAIKSLLKVLNQMEAKEGTYVTGIGMDEETEKEYITYKKSLEIKINRL